MRNCRRVDPRQTRSRARVAGVWAVHMSTASCVPSRIRVAFGVCIQWEFRLSGVSHLPVHSGYRHFFWKRTIRIPYTVPSSRPNTSRVEECLRRPFEWRSSETHIECSRLQTTRHLRPGSVATFYATLYVQMHERAIVRRNTNRYHGLVNVNQVLARTLNRESLQGRTDNRVD